MIEAFIPPLQREIYGTLTPYLIVRDAAAAPKLYGDRSGTVVDPFGHQWTIATHTEDLSPEEMHERMAQQHK